MATIYKLQPTSSPAPRPMSYQTRYYPESAFGGFTHVDGTIAFYSRVSALLSPDAVVLDAGCGRGSYAEDPVAWRRDLRIFQGRCQRVIGIDLDPRAAEHPFLDEFHLLESPRWPLEDESVDVVISDYVVEHLSHPVGYFAEAMRVLRPGGHFCLRTPNAWGYVALSARLIPNRWHARVVGKVQDDRQAEDVFPTFYRCNTRRRLASALRCAGFEACVYGHEAEPSYLSFSRWSYWAGVLYQRLAPRGMTNTLFGFAQKPCAAHEV